MERKNDILDIYTKEVEGIKEAGLFKGEAPFVSPQYFCRSHGWLFR